MSSLFGHYFAGRRDDASLDNSSVGHHVNEQFMQQSLSHMERMKQMMMRMEEKLDTVESRCEQLETKCSSLESTLQSTSRSLKEHVDRKLDSLYSNLDSKCESYERRLKAEQTKVEDKVDTLQLKIDEAQKFHAFNAMLARNQFWEYSTEIKSYDWLDDEGESAYLVKTAEALKEKTISMRQGEFPDFHNDIEDKSAKGISLVDMDEVGYSNTRLDRHFAEFVKALDHFTPAMHMLSDQYHSFFEIDFNLNFVTKFMLRGALKTKPFIYMRFVNDRNLVGFDRGGMSIDYVADIVKSNQKLRRLQLRYRNNFPRSEINDFCSVVYNHPSLVTLDLSESFDAGTGDAMLTSLIANGELKLEKLLLLNNMITSVPIMSLAAFLTSNTTLTYLNLDGNMLTDLDAELIANALRNNSTLERLGLKDNQITDSGIESFGRVFFDPSSLNAAADSNNRCFLEDFDYHIDSNPNFSQLTEDNRGRKVYSILSFRNRTLTNVHYFGNMDVKHLPNMLEVIYAYKSVIDGEYNYPEEEYYHSYLPVKCLSIIYEVMRKWDKVFNFYKAGGVAK